MNPRFLILLIVTSRLATQCSARNWIPTFAGPYRIFIRSVNNISDEYPNSSGKIWGHYYLTHPKAKEPQYIRGIHYGGIPITDEMTFELKLAVRSNNQWKRNAFVLKYNKACSSFLSFAPWFRSVFYEPDSKCPLPKVGAKVIKNQTFTPYFPDYPVMPYNRYLSTVAIYKDEELVGIIVADTDIAPKNSTVHSRAV